MMISFPRLYMRFIELIGFPLMMFVAMGGLHFVGLWGFLVEDSARGSTRTSRPWITIDGYDIQPGTDIERIIVAARGIHAESRDNGLVMRIDEIRLALPRNKPGAEYSGISLLVYQGSQVIGRFRDVEQRGILHRQDPVQFIRDWTGFVPGTGDRCIRQACKARLIVTVESSTHAIHAVNTTLAPFQAGTSETLELPEAEPSRHWDVYYLRALSAHHAKQYSEARRLYQEAMDFIGSTQDANHSAIARIQFDLARIEKTQKNAREFERRMKIAYTILDQKTDALVTEELRPARIRLDKEMVASKLGGHYWHQRDYGNSYRYYRLAYDAVAELDTSDYSRNLRRARNSSGIMASSCMLGRESESREAMAELERRYKDLEPGAQKSLDYWIRSGKRFLNGGRCNK